MLKGIWRLALLTVLWAPTSTALHADEVGTTLRWPAEKAWQWYRGRPWLVGFNFVPSTACNDTEIWQAETFDAPSINRELGIAQATGFDTTRVFLQYLVWKHDPEGLKQRLARFLKIAAAHGISVVPVLFDDCCFGDPPIHEPYLVSVADRILRDPARLSLIKKDASLSSWYFTNHEGEQGCVANKKPCCALNPRMTGCRRSYATIVPDIGPSVKCSTGTARY